MATALRIKFDKHSSFNPGLELTAPGHLLNVSEICTESLPTSDTTHPTHFTDIKVYRLIHSNEHSTVYRALMEGLPVVIKFAFVEDDDSSAFEDDDSSAIEDLEREAGHYQNGLKKICGSVVPAFHGFFRGTIPASAYTNVSIREPDTFVAQADRHALNPNTNELASDPAGDDSHSPPVSCVSESQDVRDPQPFVCLLLEDCGVRLGDELWIDVASMDDKRQVLELLTIIHQAGYDCMDLFPRNVVRNRETGKCRLIDFHHLSPHECEFSGEWNFDAEQPDRQDFGCSILFDLAAMWEFWYPPGVVVIGNHKYSVGSIPKRAIVDQLVEGPMLERWNEPYMIKWLMQVMKDIFMHGLNQADMADMEKIVRLALESKPRFPLTSKEFKEVYESGYYMDKYGPEIE